MKITEKKSKKKWAIGICIIIMLVVISSFIYTGRSYGNQSQEAMYPHVEFCGEFKVADGEWTRYSKDMHIPSDKGEITLRGFFELFAPDTDENLGKVQKGTPIAFYLNHIGGEISEDGVNFYPFDTELEIAGEDMCGAMYAGYEYGGGEEVTIKLNNPHKFGNSHAVDQFLTNLGIYMGSDFERDTLSRDNVQRMWGFVLILAAFMILGTAILSMLIHMNSNKYLWLSGLIVMFAGVYFIFSAHAVVFFSDIIKFNTRVYGASMMLYMFCLIVLLAFHISDKAKKTGGIMILVLAIYIIGAAALSISGKVKFYDTLPLWAIIQGLCCMVMTCFLAYQFSQGKEKDELICAFGMLPMIAFLIDVVANFATWWQGGTASENIFILVFFVALVMFLKVIPKGINSSIRAKELETERKLLKAELAESRIAILISQIQPHFIYNTLGTIEQLCITEPEAASKLVRDFSLYLRGNFSELDNSKPIRFSQEMNHVGHYTDIEHVRFPDMTIKYDLQCVDFVIPALSVQPLVENAIKHGLMGLEEGGTVSISSYETDTHYIVEVTDDGIGFDTDAVYDDKKHIGIKNIKARIEAMSNGTLTIESKKGAGTKATIKIPKETVQDDSDNR